MTNTLTTIEEKLILRDTEETQKEEYYGIKNAENRLLFIKTQELINEFTQVLIFFEELEKYWQGDTEILQKIQRLHSRLCVPEKTDEYMRIVNLLSRYLREIWNFASITENKSVIFYKKIFESALISITNELDTPEMITSEIQNR